MPDFGEHIQIIEEGVSIMNIYACIPQWIKPVIKNLLPEHTVPWEYSFYKKHGFYEALNRDDFKNNYLQLIEGLDEESVQTVDRILARLQLMRKWHGFPFGLYNSKEKRDVRELVRDLDREIKKVSNDCYQYKQYKLPIRHFEACVFVGCHEITEIDTDPSVLREKDIIDAGGFIGDSVLVLAPYTEKKIYTFEPMKKNFDLLKKTMELNEIQNVVCENVALGSKKGTVIFEENGSSSGRNETNVRGGRIPVITLDDYVRENHLHVGLIKTDLEGMEQDFLLGAKETITTQKPVLLLSMYHNPSDFFKMKQLLDSWHVGYRFKVRRGKEYTICTETMLIAEVL